MTPISPEPGAGGRRTASTSRSDQQADVPFFVSGCETPNEVAPPEMQRRLLVEPLNRCWTGPTGGQPFLVAASVPLYYGIRLPPLLADVLFSLEIQPTDDLWKNANHRYFVWDFGKVPEVVIRIVANRDGAKDDGGLRDFARIGVGNYVIFDPQNLLGGGKFRAFSLRGRTYEPLPNAWFPEIGLALTLWKGTFEGTEAVWLRWCGKDGHLIPTKLEMSKTKSRRALGVDPSP